LAGHRCEPESRTGLLALFRAPGRPGHQPRRPGTGSGPAVASQP